MGLMDQRRSRQSLRLMYFGAGVCGALLGSCSLVLDFGGSVAADIDSGISDAGTPDVTITADARNCALFDPSNLEPNDDNAEAVVLVGSIESAICATEAGADIDVFTFTTLTVDDAVITLTLDALAVGNLDLRLRNGDGAVISEATGTGTVDQLSHTLANGNRLPIDTYFVEVYPSEPETTETYTIALTLGVAK